MTALPTRVSGYIALMACIVACGGKVVPGESPMGSGPASAGSSVAGSPGISTGEQGGAGATAGSGAADYGSGGVSIVDPNSGTAICNEKPASYWWPAACPHDSGEYGFSVSSPGDVASAEVLPSTCTCGGCAPGIEANYDQCTNGWSLSFSACSEPQRCAALGLHFEYAKELGSNGDFTVSGASFVDTSAFSWRLDSAVLHDQLGDFGGPDVSPLGKALSFELTAIAVDPGGARPSWKLLAHVRACVASSNACAK